MKATHASCFFFATTALLAARAIPVVSNVAVSQEERSSDVRISYSLSEEAIVTVQVFTNNVAIDDADVHYLLGDVNHVVSPGESKAMVWKAGESWEGHTNAHFTAEVTAWTQDNPPPYCSVDLSCTTSSTNYTLAYYPSANAVEGGVTNNRYKFSHLLLRKIPVPGSAGFTMGSPVGDKGRCSIDNREASHSVRLTNSFYLGVFEVSQEQWWLVKRAAPSEIPHIWRPVTKVSYDDICGASAGSAWPTNDEVDADSFLGILRARTPFAFTLPTEAEWEYACKAGSSTPLYNGGWDDSSLLSIACCRGNASNKTAYVGSYLPNAFGLYDMLGNVWEWCRDGYVLDLRKQERISPRIAVSSGGERVIKGGSYSDMTSGANGTSCRASARYPCSANLRAYNLGLRVSVPLR